MQFDPIPYATQDITDEDIKSVNEVLKSKFLTQGPKVVEFENSLASYTGAKHVLSFNSATSALHSACLALGIGKGDIVWTTAITFVASSNCALYCGARVDFLDISIKNFNIDLEHLKTKLEKAAINEQLPKLLIAVHFAGLSCDMVEISRLAKKYGFSVIEDASHAIGGEYCGTKIGCCKYSDITIFSFHPVKIITTGEGGAALTNDDNLSRSMALIRSHGITKDTNRYVCDPQVPEIYYEQQVLGFNYRMTDIHAALGVSQLKRLDQYVARRNDIAQYYRREIGDRYVSHQEVVGNVLSAFHLYVIKLDDESYEKRKVLFYALKELNIVCNLHYIPVYNQPFYKEIGYGFDNCPNADLYSKTVLSIPMFPSMTDFQVEYVAAKINEQLSCLM